MIIMRNTLLQISIVYTILYVSIFHMGGCWCKKKVTDSTTIETKSKKEPEKKVTADSEGTAPDDLASVDALDKDENDKDHKQNKNDEDEGFDIEKQLVAEQQRLEKKILLVEEAEETEEEADRLQYSFYDPSYNNPSAPDLFSQNNSHEWDNNNVASSLPYNYNNNDLMPTSSRSCTNCCKGNNREFDEEDINSLRENLSTKQKIMRYYLEVVNKLTDTLKLYPKSNHIYLLKDKLLELQEQQKNLEKEIKKVSSNRALCSKHKAKELQNNLLPELGKVDNAIKRFGNIIMTIRDKKNNKSDKPSNEGTPYPNEQYASAPYPPVDIVDAPPPPYSLTNNSQDLYPPIPKLS